jgi:hypothetical protein
MRVGSVSAIEKSTPMIRLLRQPDAADFFDRISQVRTCRRGGSHRPIGGTPRTRQRAADQLTSDHRRDASALRRSWQEATRPCARRVRGPLTGWIAGRSGRPEESRPIPEGRRPLPGPGVTRMPWGVDLGQIRPWRAWMAAYPRHLECRGIPVGRLGPDKTGCITRRGGWVGSSLSKFTIRCSLKPRGFIDATQLSQCSKQCPRRAFCLL